MELKSAFGGLTMAAIIGIVVISLVGSSTVLSQYQKLRAEDDATIEISRMRDGVFAILDVVRAHNAVEAAITAGNLNGPAGHELFEAADFLFVRTEAFRSGLGDDPSDEALQVAQTLNAMVALLDAMMATPDRISVSRREVGQPIKQASAALVRFYDEQKKRHVQSVARQGALLQTLVQTTIGLIMMFMVITIASVFLWRSEFMARTRRRAAEKRANRLAYYDTLTGLPNRASFMKAASQIMGSDSSPALMLIDLDEFKAINDTHGHHIGDAALQLVAGRLSSIFGQHGGIAARLGGDEFAAMLPNGGKMNALDGFIQNLIDQIAVPDMCEGVRISPRLSLGAAAPDMLDPSEAPSLDALMRAADYALYEAKSAGRFTGRIYDHEMAAKIAERRELKQEMPTALERGDFFLEYQPQFNLKTGALHGFEALARWRRNGGVIPPGVFIDIAEEDDFIIQLDAWVLREASKQAVAWNAVSAEPLRISANLSARNFRSPTLISDVERTIQETGLKPELLTLELTESVLIEDWSMTLGTLDELAGLGMKIALDDFGTGFSSLSYLRRLKVDEVKIDRAFVIDLETSDRTRMMMDALVDISRGLGMQLTVEGIETRGQAEILAELGGDIGQGFLFSWPVAAEDAQKLIDAGVGIDAFTHASEGINVERKAG